MPKLAPYLNGVFELTGTSLHPVTIDPNATLICLALVSSCIALLAASAPLLTHSKWLLPKFVVGIALSLIGLAAAQHYFEAQSIYWIDGVPQFIRTEFFGTFVNPNHAGFWLAVALPLSIGLISSARKTTPDTSVLLRSTWHHPKGLICLAVPCIIAVGIWVTGSRGALVGAMIAIVVLVAIMGTHNTRVGLSAFIGVVVVPIWLFQPVDLMWWLSINFIPEGHLQDLSGHRFEIWRDSIELIKAAPMGVGPGGFEDGFKWAKTLPHFSTVSHAHNDLIEVLTTNGLLVGSLWIASGLTAIGVSLRQVIRTPREHRMAPACIWAALMALTTAMMVDFPLRVGALSILLTLLIGVALQYNVADETTSPRSNRDIRWAATGMAGLALISIACWFGGIFANPNAETHQGQLAHVRYQSGDINAAQIAADHYVTALQSAPFHHSALLALGQLQWQQGQEEDAEHSFELVTMGYPTLPWGWLELARLRAQQGDIEGSWSAWHGMLQVNLPNNDDADHFIHEALNTGNSLLAAQHAIPPRADRLIDAAKKLVELATDQPAAIAVAEAMFLQAINLDLNRSVDYAAALVRWDRPQDALSVIETNALSGCGPARITAKAHHAMSDYDEAVGHWQQAFQVCGSNDPITKIGFIRSGLKTGHSSAIYTATELLKDNPSRHGLRRALIDSLQSHPQYRKLWLEHLAFLVTNEVATPTEVETYMLAVTPQPEPTDNH